MRLPSCLAILCVCGLGGLWADPAAAQASNVRITGLSDVAFGTLSTSGADAILSQSVCAYSNSATKGYRVTASGSGASGAFTLASGARTLAYEVQWNKLSGQASGSSLSPNVALTGQTSTATQQACNSGPATSGSLIVIIRGSSAGIATAGSYSGTLTLVLAPE